MITGKKTKNTMAAAAIRGGVVGCERESELLAALGMCSQALCTTRDCAATAGRHKTNTKTQKKKVGGKKGWRGARRDEMQAAGG